MLWNPIEINSNKIIIIKTIVGFMIKNENKMQFKITFHISNQNILFRYSKESSQWEGSFKHPKTNVKIDVKEIFHNFKPNIFSSPEPKAHG